jgi:uncharacterized SAM-binding protein YcdF (DUF218 family)
MPFAITKLLWALVQPSNLLLLGLIVASVALFIHRWQGARWLVIGIATALSLISLLPIGQWLLMPLEARFADVGDLPGPVDGVIVLGGAVQRAATEGRAQIAFGDSAERAIALIELGHLYPHARLVYSGGSGRLVGRSIGPADALRMFYQRQRFDVGRIIFEDRSRNTYENAIFSKRLLAPKPGERWLLVTSAAHMPRAIGIFRHVNWPMIPYPVDYQTPGDWSLSEQLDRLVQLDVSGRLREFDLAVKSWLGLMAYWFLGRTSALFPGP